MRKYILDGQTPVEEQDLQKWCEWYETADRTVKKNEIGRFQVSTVFLGMDHNLIGIGDPILFETMVFGEGELSGETDRCHTWEEAEAMHEAMCALAMRIEK